MDASFAINLMGAGLPANPISLGTAMREERLPFTVRVARDEGQLRKAVSIRQRAYGRHVPALGELLRLPEAKDREQGCVVLVAESKLDGEPLGTLRIQTNRHRSLAIESSVELPEWLTGHVLGEATRLGVAEGRPGRVVKTMLFKALYLYCQDQGIEWMVIGARPPLDRMYEALLFADVFPDKAYFPLKHAGNIPHRILALDIAGADARWRSVKHPMYDLFTKTRHPDIDIRETEFEFDFPAQQVAFAAGIAA
jgi:N-acyl amino acid synthase FeeM